MQYVNFGKFINEKRKALLPDISLNKFAINNDIDPATLSRIENGKQGVSISLLSKLANGFGISGSKLLSEYEKLYTN